MRTEFQNGKKSKKKRNQLWAFDSCVAWCFFSSSFENFDLILRPTYLIWKIFCFSTVHNNARSPYAMFQTQRTDGLTNGWFKSIKNALDIAWLSIRQRIKIYVFTQLSRSQNKKKPKWSGSHRKFVSIEMKWWICTICVQLQYRNGDLFRLNERERERGCRATDAKLFKKFRIKSN